MTSRAASSSELVKALRAVTVGARRRRAGSLLGPAPDPETLGAERRAVARRVDVSSGGGGGIAWPLVEQEYTGTEYHMLVSSTGLLTLEQPASTTYQDGAGAQGDVVHRDPSA